MDKTFPLDGPITVRVRIPHGHVRVHAGEDSATARVTLHAKDGKTDILDRTLVDLRDGTLVVQTPRQGGIFDLAFWGKRERDALDVDITVPAGTPLKLSTFTAPITVTGRSGSTDVAFGAASAELADVDGDLRLRFGSGTASAGHVRGTVELRSGAGDARLGEVGGAITAGCGSGSLEVQVAHGSIRSRTGSGSARIGAAHGDIDLVSGSGNLQIGLPDGVSARLDITSGSGRVDSELPIDDAPASGPSLTKTAPITLRARTGSGVVRLFRAA